VRPRHFIQIQPHEYNPGRVMNQGMQLARSEFGIFLNADATRVMRLVSETQSAPAPQSSPVSQRSAVPQSVAEPESRKRINPLYFGAAAAALLVIAVGGWFALRNGTESQVALKDPGTYAPAGQVTAPNPVAPPAAPGPIGQAPAVADVAPGPPASAVLPPSAPKPAEQAAIRPSAPPATTPVPSEQPPIPRNDTPAAVAPAFRPSFDCAKAGNNAERIVCSDSQLAALDVKMSDLYKRGLSSVTDSNVFLGEQQIWLSQRDDCTDKECLVISYNDRIKELERWVGR